MTNTGMGRDHGPQGDPSWLGGGDRQQWGGGGSTSGDGTAAGGSDPAPESARPDADFGPSFGDPTPQPAPERTEAWAPSFGDAREQGGRPRGTGGQGKSLASKLSGLLVSSVGVIFFMIFALNWGMNYGWVVLFVLGPIAIRAVKIVQQHFSHR